MNLFSLILSAILSFSTGFINAGGVLSLYSVDLPSGKRIIMFGEQHQGEIETIGHGAIPIRAVEENQHVALFNLFKNDLGPIRDATATYLECNDDLCQDFKERMTAKMTTGQPHEVVILALTDYFRNKSWFDHYYQLLYAMGTRTSAHVDSIKNFDGRATLDLAILYRAIKFSNILEKYAKSNFDQAYLEKAKKKFFAHDEYRYFKMHEERWLKAVTQPVVDKVLALRIQ